VTNEDNNLGKNCFDYLRIKNLFYRIYFFIKNTPINNTQSYLTPFISKKDVEVLISEDDI